MMDDLLDEFDRETMLEIPRGYLSFDSSSSVNVWAGAESRKR